MNTSHSDSSELIAAAANRLDKRVPPATPIRPQPRVSFEFFPPATPAGMGSLHKSVDALAPFAPTFASVTYGAGGSGQEKTFAAIETLRERQDLDVAGHLTCVAANTDTVNAVIDTYVASGVRRIVALRGDAPADAVGCAVDGTHPDGYRDAADLVAGIRQRPDGHMFDISVGAYPEVHPKAASAEADIESLKAKLDAGADRAITQFFFEADTFLRFLDRARSARITAPIVPGIMPITSFAGVCRFSARCGTNVPTWMHELFDGLEDAPEVSDLVSATLAAELCKQLMEHGVSDFHFYTMNKPNLTAATCRILGLTPTRPAVTESVTTTSAVS